jgi:hypothetical protein
VFYGSKAAVGPYFAAHPLHMTCPPQTSPGDWMLDQSSLDYRTETSEAATVERNMRMIAQFQAMQAQGKMLDGNDVFHDLTDAPHQLRTKRLSGASSESMKLETGRIALVQRAPFRLAFGVLFRRSWINFYRQPLLVSARVGQVLAFAIILMLYYTRLGRDQDSVQNRLGLVQEFTAVLFIGMLNCIAVFVVRRRQQSAHAHDGGGDGMGMADRMPCRACVSLYPG